MGTWSNEGIITITPGSVLNAQSFAQSSTGRTELEAVGTSASEFGRIVVTGNAAFNGTLLMRINAGFSPTIGDRFDAITYGTRSMHFSDVQSDGLDLALALISQYLTDRLRLEITTAP